MQTSLVLTIVCADEPGIVERVARVISAHGGSWEESRMARLAGRFAGILRVAIPSERVPQLEAALEALRGAGTEVAIQRGDASVLSVEPRIVRLQTIGTDRPGIVHGVFRLLAGHGVNVQELHTEVMTAPMSGERLFRADARIALPPDLSVATLRDQLEAIGQDLSVDVSIAD